jgi:hypothetical protein
MDEEPPPGEKIPTFPDFESAEEEMLRQREKGCHLRAVWVPSSSASLLPDLGDGPLLHLGLRGDYQQARTK